MRDWQPIATAPKDGTPILIYQPDYEDGGEHAYGRHTMGAEHYAEDRDMLFDDNRYAIGYWRPWGGWGNRNSATVRPTHWMPLPALPLRRADVQRGSAPDAPSAPLAGTERP